MDSDRLKRIRLMILGRVLLAPFLAVFCVFGTLVYYFATNLRHQVETKLDYIAGAHLRLVDQFLLERTLDLQYVAASGSFDQISSNENLALLLERLQNRSRAFFDLGVFDEKGSHVAYVGPFDLKGKDYSQAEWFQQVQQKSIYVSDVFLGYRNIPHFVIAVRRDEGERSWYLRATIDTFYFNDLVESIRVGRTGEAYLVNDSGIFQTKRRSGGSLMKTDPEFATYTVEKSDVASFTAESADGRRFLYATGKIPSTNWILVVRQEFGDAYAPLIRAVLVALGIIVLGGALVFFAAFVLATSVANRLTVADMEKKQMGAQLIQAGKLAEVGEMSAGVAHEINNPLQVMKAEEAMIKDVIKDLRAEGVLSESENVRLLEDSVSQIGIQIDRCKRITDGLLRFARQSEASFKTIELEPFIDEVVGMVERKAAVENIIVVKDMEENLPPIRSDPAQLQQVLLNLLNNAVDAMKGREDGEIRVAAARDDGMLVLAVTDNGCGISEKNLDKIFVPFFTTKPVGRGTGLGLSTVFGIVERLGGRIEVSSEVNAGSVFTVRLPLEGPAESPDGKPRPAAPEARRESSRDRR
jgi:two-component system NtrC family sensor kinase